MVPPVLGWPADTTVLAGVAFFSQQGVGREVPREAIIGLTYGAATAYTIIFLSISKR